MLRLTRVKNPGVGLELLKNVLVPPSGVSASDYAQAISRLLVEAPRETFLMILWTMADEKEPDVKGFILAFAPQGVDYVSLLQSHPLESHTSLIDAFGLWVESQHRSKVRFEQFDGTTNVPSFLRFKVVSHILEHTVIRDVDGTHELPENVTRNEIKETEKKNE
jgi:hypothetical protein